MRSLFWVAMTALVVATGCEASNRQNEPAAGAANQQRLENSAVAEAGNDHAEGQRRMPVDANFAAPVPEPGSGTAGILASSSPTDGASLSSSPVNLVLRFNRPVRLQEITVVGSDGQAMPMMITPADAAERYSVPLPELEAGSYTVNWRASGERGTEHSGNIRFTIR